MRPRQAEPRDPKSDVQRLRVAFDSAQRAIVGLRRRSQEIGLGAEARFLDTYAEILADGRLRERATELAEQGEGLAGALSQVAREATRNAASLTRDRFMEERARDLEDLCDALTMLADADQRSAVPSKAILLGDALTVYDLIVTARSNPAGVALSERASGPRTHALLKLMNVPAVTEVKALFRWASDGDIALLDGDHGLIVINPSKSEVASLREDRRRLGSRPHE